MIKYLIPPAKTDLLLYHQIACFILFILLLPGGFAVALYCYIFFLNLRINIFNIKSK